MSNYQAENPISEQEKLKLLQKILHHPQNRVCADCSAHEPTWASLKFGVWVCLNCSGYHRNLGATLTRIQSAYLDEWSLSELEIFLSLTNTISNHYWEANLNTEVDNKPCPEHDPQQGLSFVRAKYVEKRFILPDSKNPAEHYSDFGPVTSHYYNKDIQDEVSEANSRAVRADKRGTSRTSIFEGMKIKVKQYEAQTERHFSRNNNIYLEDEFEPLVKTSKAVTQQVLSLQEIPSEPLPTSRTQFHRANIARNSTIIVTSELDKHSSHKFYNLSIARDSLRAPHSLSPLTKPHEHSLAARHSYEPKGNNNGSLISFDHEKGIDIPSTKQSITERCPNSQAHKDYFLRFKKFYHRRHREMLVLGGFLLHLILGSFFVWETIAPYIISYLKLFNSGLDYEFFTSTVFFAQIFSTALGLPFGVRLGKAYGHRRVLFICSFIYCLSIFMSSLTTRSSRFILLFSIFPGICRGLIYMIPIYCAWECFPKKEGVVAGIITCAPGLSVVLFSGLSHFIVNPHALDPLFGSSSSGIALYFSPAIHERVLLMLRSISIIFLIIMVSGSLLICPKVTVENLNISLLDEEPIMDQIRKGSFQSRNQHSDCPDIKTGLKSKTFQNLALLMAITSMTISYVWSNFTALTEINAFSHRLLNVVWIFAILANGISCIFWAKLYERLSFKTICSMMFITQGLLIVVLEISGKYSFCYVFSIIGLLFCEGFSYSVFPVFTMRFFGMRFCMELYGTLFWVYPFVNILTQIIKHTLVGLIGYEITLALFLIPLSFGCYLCVSMAEQTNWKPSEDWIELKNKIMI